MNNKRIVKNIGVSMVMKPISMVLSLVYIPIVLSFLGEEKYGIWVIILNVISWINYFDIGIGNGLRNKLSESISLGDEESANMYVSTAYVGTSIVSVAFCIIVTLLWNLLKLSEYFNITCSDENTNTVIFVSVLFVCINFVVSLSKTAAYSLQQPGYISVVAVLSQVFQIVALLILSKFFKESLIVVALMYGIISLFDSFILYFFLSKKHSYLKPKIRSVDTGHMKSLLTLGFGFFIMQICTLVLNTTDNLLISKLYGSADVTPYSMVYKVFYLVVQVHGIIIMPMWSAYTAASVQKDIGWITSTMKKINLITLAFSICTIIGIFIFEPFAAIWLGKRLEYGSLLITSVAVYMIVQMFANNYSSFLCGIGCVKPAAILAIFQSALNIPLSIIFAKILGLGLAGIILGSLAVIILSLICFPIVSYRWISTKKKEWNYVE